MESADIIISQLQAIRADHSGLSNDEILKILQIMKLEDIKLALNRKG